MPARPSRTRPRTSSKALALMVKGRMPGLVCGPFLLALALLSACGNEADSPTAAQNAELDRAEQMLNEAPGGLAGIDANALGGPTQPENSGASGEEPR